MSSVKIGAAYVRVSSDDQLEYSPDSQLKVIRDYAKREGYVVPDEYVYQDDGISGKSAARRPAFRLMIATAKEPSPPFDSIFVWKYSRFARNQEEAIMYKNLLRKKGITVRSISEPSSDSPFASLIERIIEWMDEYYLINLSTEVRRGMVEKASRGEATGSPPFGYSVKDKIYVPNEQACTVRWIFEQAAAGKGSRAIAADLSAQGVRTPRGGVPDNRWVDYILDNPVYIGKVRYSTEGHANYSRAGYSDEHVMIVDGRHEAIISSELWAAVRERRKGRSTETPYVRRGNPKIYMLKGLIRCSACGSTLTLLSTSSPSLQCHKYSRGQCHTSHSITVKKANALTIDALERIVAVQEYRFMPAAPPKRKIVHDWDKLIASEEAKLKRARNALLEGVFTPAEYAEARAEIEETLEQLRAGKAAEEPADPEPIDLAAYTRKVSAVLDIVRSDEVSEQAKNEALRSIINHIIYDKSTGFLDFYFY